MNVLLGYIVNIFLSISMDENKLYTTVELCFCANPALLVCCMVLFFLVHSNSVECLTEDSRTLKKYGVADSEVVISIFFFSFLKINSLD